jgi:hypothetical protein
LLAFALVAFLSVVAASVLGTHLVEQALRPGPTQGSAATGEALGSSVLSSKAQTCEAAAEATQRALRHWSSYMDDVQTLYLATSTAQIAEDLRQLSGSYRAVVHDTVPVHDQINACLAADAS